MKKRQLELKVDLLEEKLLYLTDKVTYLETQLNQRDPQDAKKETDGE